MALKCLIVLSGIWQEGPGVCSMEALELGIAAGDAPNEIRKYVSDATGELISRLIGMLDDIESEGIF